MSETQSNTDENGTAQIQVSSKDIITTVVTAKLAGGNALATPSLAFTADISTAKVATIDNEKQQVVANNTDTDTLTAQVTDSYNHPLSGVTVNWTVERTDNTPVATKTSTTDSSGNAILALKSSKTGTVTVSAEVNGTAQQESDPITFVADVSSATVSLITLSKAQTVANGTSNITYEATVTDAKGNVVEGTPVSWSTDNPDVKLSATQTTSDSSGKSQVAATSQKAGEVVVSAGTSSATMRQADLATFTADNSSAAVTKLTSDRQSALANGTDGIVLSATVLDANSNPLQNADVSWASDPATGALSASMTKTDTNGVAKVTLTSQDVATYSVTAGINSSAKKTSDLSFIADTSTAHLEKLNASAASVLADGNTAITLTTNVVDQAGHPVKNEKINWSADNNKAQLSATQSVTDELGQAQIQVTSSEVMTTVVTAQHDQAEALKTAALSFTADTASAKVATVDTDKNQVIANNLDSSTVTAQVLDNYNHPLNGITVNWKATQTDGTSIKSNTSVTDSNGNATWTLKSAKTGVLTVSADVSGTASKETGQITFVADSSSQSVSLVNPDKTQATATGADSITYTATVRDAQGNAVPDSRVNWSADNPAAKLSSTQTTSGSDGTSHITVTSVKAGDVVLTAKTSDMTPKQAEKVTFIADTATAKVFAIASDKASALANGSDAITVEATVTDANDNPLHDSDVNWAASPATGKLSTDSSKTDASGVAQIKLTSGDVAKFKVVASANGTTKSLEDLSFTADSSTAMLSSLTADKTTDIVAGKDTIPLTALVVDAQQHPVPGATVNWSSSDTESHISVNSSITGDDGTATVTFSSLKAGSIDVTATTGSSSKTQTMQITGNLDTAKVTGITPDKSQAVADGTEIITWTATVTDANDNVLTGATINWSTSLEGVTLTPSGSDTDAEGKAIVTGTSLKAGDVKVTATPVKNSSGQKTDGATKFVGDAKTARLTQLTPSITNVPINGNGVTYTAVVNDVNDNPVQGVSVSWQTDLNTLSASESTTDNAGKAKVTLKGGTRGPARVTANANSTTISDSSVTFVDIIIYDWNITGTSDKYNGEQIVDYPAVGFIVNGNTQGPTSLIWNGSAHTPSTLTVPMTDDKGVSHDVIFKGSKFSDCAQVQFNSGIACQTGKSYPRVLFDVSDNPDLPAGHYTGPITFNGQEWHTNANLLSYKILTSLTIN